MSVGSEPPGASIRRLTADDLELYRSVRLRALRDAPDAFGSVYEDEAALDNAGWRTKWESWTGPPGGAVWAATLGNSGMGLVGCVRERETANRAWLISMWVDPVVRRRGVARSLIASAVGWGRGEGLDRIDLEVTSNNHAARRLYDRMGFEMTNRSRPHPRKSGLREHEMVLLL
ncbi:MAG: GNAT family N-acetyltransferase [Planctomycetota bacterium]